MNDDLILFGSGLDQSLPTEKDFSWLKDEVDNRLSNAIQSGDLDAAGDLVEGLVKVTKASGKELAKVLYTLNTNWNVFNTDEAFLEWAYLRSGLHRHTIERYVKVEELFSGESVPEDIKPFLAEKNLAELFPIANMVDQGYEPDSDQWKDIILQPDESSIRNKVREIKEQEPRKTALILKIDDMGSIWAIKEGVRKFIGSLELSDEDEVVQKAIKRIITNSGILR